MKRDYEDPAYIKFRNTVLRRDKYKCQFPGCKKRSRKWLHVHHIIPWSVAYGLRTDPTNGICLCPTHHKEITGYEHLWINLFSQLVVQNENNKRYKRNKRV